MTLLDFGGQTSRSQQA